MVNRAGAARVGCGRRIGRASARSGRLREGIPCWFGAKTARRRGERHGCRRDRPHESVRFRTIRRWRARGAAFRRGRRDWTRRHDSRPICCMGMRRSRRHRHVHDLSWREVLGHRTTVEGLWRNFVPEVAPVIGRLVLDAAVRADYQTAQPPRPAMIESDHGPGMACNCGA